MKNIIQSTLLSTLICFCSTWTEEQEQSSEQIINIHNAQEFLAEHSQEIPCVKIMFALLIKNEAEYNKQNWLDIVQIAHNLAELLETNSSPSSVALLTPGIALLEQYKNQDAENIEGFLHLNLFDTIITDEDLSEITHPANTPFSVRHLFSENTDCVIISLNIERDESTNPETWDRTLQAACGILESLERTDVQSMTELIVPHLFDIEDLQKTDSSIAVTIEILA